MTEFMREVVQIVGFGLLAFTSDIDHREVPRFARRLSFERPSVFLHTASPSLGRTCRTSALLIAPRAQVVFPDRLRPNSKSTSKRVVSSRQTGCNLKGSRGTRSGCLAQSANRR